MTRYKATISYDGTLFAGFQRQPHARSVQEEIEKTWRVSIKEILWPSMERGERIPVSMLLGRWFILISSSAGRGKLRFALDTQTPEDIDFIRVEQVADDFHSRYKKHSKTYEFIVDYGRPKNPMMRHYATHYPYSLDVEKMQAAIQKVGGNPWFHRLYSFGNQCGRQGSYDYRGLVEDAEHHRLVFTFSGNGFLYKQIRNMVGTLLKIEMIGCRSSRSI